MSDEQRPVVAELGRPETPEETAARVAERRRKHRANQTTVNLLLALLASLAVVIGLVAVVVRPDAPVREPVDYASVAAEFGDSIGHPLIAPEAPEGWWSNRADVRPVDGVSTWYIGLITAEELFVSLEQGIGANPSWEAARVRGGTSTGMRDIGGVRWTEYDQRTTRDIGNAAYALSASFGDDTVVLAGTATDGDFLELAEAVVAALPDELRERNEG